jgi:cbb3-type cytochrome oxidase subunit 3
MANVVVGGRAQKNVIVFIIFFLSYIWIKVVRFMNKKSQ